MNQTSSVQSLSQLIQAKRDADKQKIEQLTQRELQQLAESLKQQSAAALSTTEAAIQQIQQQVETASRSAEALNATTDKQRQQLQIANQRQLKQLEAQTKAEVKRLAWMLRLPMLVLLIACLLICAATWGWWRMSAPYQIQTAPDGLRWQIMKGDGWRMCQNQPCRPTN